MGARSEPRIDRTIWLDGEFVAWQDATVHVLSHSLQRGSLIFDYMSVHETPRGPAVFRLHEHAERLLASAELVGLPLMPDLAAVEAAIIETVRRNPGCTAVKASAFLPSIEIDVVPADPRVSLAIAAYDPRGDVQAHKPAAEPKPEAAKIWIEKVVKNRRHDILPPQAKVAANYTSPMLAKWKARKAGYDEILLVDEAGDVAEGPTANVFLVDASDRVVTPIDDIVLLGVTRLSILEIARAEGMTVVEERVRPEALWAAKEVFLTGTTAGVWPVESVDDTPIGGGAAVPGPVATKLLARFREITGGLDADFAHWLTFVNEA